MVNLNGLKPLFIVIIIVVVCKVHSENQDFLLLPPKATMLVVLVVITQKDPMKSIALWLIKSTLTIFCLKALELDSTSTENAFPGKKHTMQSKFHLQ